MLSRKKRWFSLTVSLMLLAAFPMTGFVNSATESLDENRFSTTGFYHIPEVKSKEQRTEIARTGASIEEVGADYVRVLATDTELKSLKEKGFQPKAEPVLGTLDFPDPTPATTTMTKWLKRLIKPFPITATSSANSALENHMKTVTCGR